MKAKYRKGQKVNWEGHPREEMARESGAPIESKWYWWEPQIVKILRAVPQGKNDGDFRVYIISCIMTTKNRKTHHRKQMVTEDTLSPLK